MSHEHSHYIYKQWEFFTVQNIDSTVWDCAKCPDETLDPWSCHGFHYPPGPLEGAGASEQEGVALSSQKIFQMRKGCHVDTFKVDY